MNSCTLSHYLQTYFVVLFTVILSALGLSGQTSCNCNPQIEIIADKCMPLGNSSQIAFYIYNADIQNGNAHGWVKVYAGNNLLLDQSTLFSPKGFYSHVLNFIPESDTKILIEYHCKKDICYTQKYFNITTMPQYELIYTDIKCNGENNGEIVLKSQSSNNLGVLWESGEVKNHAVNMPGGSYHITVVNNNGCKEIHTINIKEPSKIEVTNSQISVKSAHGVSNYAILNVAGGNEPYYYDWDMDGMGDMDDRGKIRFYPENEGFHAVIVRDNNGCTLESQVNLKKQIQKPFNPKAGKLMSIEDMGNGLFKYDLTNIFDMANGDMDGDGNDNTVFDVIFLDKNNQEIPSNLLKTYISEPGQIKVLFANNDLDESLVALELLSGPDYCLFISQACDNNPPIELLPVECNAASTPLASGGTYEVFNYNTITGVETEEQSRLLFSGGKYYFDPTNAVDNYRIYYTVGGVRRRALFNVHGVTAQITLQSDSICGNFDQLFEIRVNSIGGTLAGEHILKDYTGVQDSVLIVGTNEFHFLKPTELTVNQSYTYSYTFTRVINSKLTCSETSSSTLKVLPYPEITINQFDAQVCTMEEVKFKTGISTTSGDPSQVTYQWYFKEGNNVTEIPNSNSSQLVVPEATSTGDYIVKATQSNGCMDQDTGTLYVINLPAINSEILTEANCFGVASAKVDVVIEGVSDSQYGDYTIYWKGKKTGVERYGRYQENLPADSFFITVTTPKLNDKGLQCSITDTVEITSRPSIGLNCSPRDTSLSCFGTFNMTRTVVVGSDATQPLSFSIVSKEGPFQNLPTFSGLGVGTDPNVLSKEYKIYVKDGNGCIDSCQFTLRQPSKLSCSLINTDLGCFNNGNGRVDATVSGGIPPYTYKWSNDVTFGPTTSTSNAILGLSAGTYNLTVTDAKNCTTTCTIEVKQPQPLSVSVNQVNICLDFTEQLTADAIGGNGTYTYEWSIVDAGSTGAVSGNLAWDPDNDYVDFDAWCLKPGEVSIRVIVTDKNGCTGSTITTVVLHSCFDLAIRKEVALPSKEYYPGDSVAFYLDIFNQGDVDAVNLTITDILDQNMEYLQDENEKSNTGNENDWQAGPGNTLTTAVTSLPAGASKRLKVFLRIKSATSSNYMVNFAEISNYSSVTENGRIKDKPIDEDDYIPDTPDTKSTERDNELCDGENASNFPEICDRNDDPDDEDRIDYAVVTICQLKGNEVDKQQCVDSGTRTDGLLLNTPQNRDALDPDGNGDGIAINDAGNLVASFHNTYMDAMDGTHSITGRIIFSNGSGGNNSSNGILTPQGDLRVFADQEVEIFARLVSLDGCIGVSVLTLDFTAMASITQSPESQVAVVDQENLCLEVETDPSYNINFAYQWQQWNGTFYEDIPGATGTEYCIDKVTESLAGAQFRVLVTDPDDQQRSCAAISSIARIELDDEPVLVCNDLVNISMDDNCQVLITPEMVLEAARLTNRLIISIKDANGNPVPNPVTAQYVGQTLTVSVIDIVNGNSCWSTVRIEDKLPPVIDCPEDYNISCANIWFTPPVPSFYDACDSGATIALVSDVFEELECSREDGVIAVRTLTYIAKDSRGNTSAPCTFHVYYHTADINDIVWPDNKVYECTDANAENVPGTDITGLPTLYGFPVYPVDQDNLQGHCKINLTYSDQIIPLCGVSYKVARSWTVLDWCSGVILKHTQLISVKDTKGPELICPQNKVYEILMDGHSCSADFVVPAPVVDYDCNETSWTVAYLVATDDGTPPANGVYVTDNLVFDGTKYTITGLPAGKTWIRYAVIDACENLSYCFAEINVRDVVVPTPVCDEYTVISLDAQGRARLFAKTIDDGSHDNCSKVTYGIRRMSNNCGLPDDAVFVANFNGNSYYTFVDFCCQDQINNTQQVELLVIDASDNMNTCMTTVEIQQKVIPSINCPGDVTLDCEADYSAEALKMFATFTSPCPVYYLAGPIDSTADYTCGEKTIFRTWQVRENGTNKVVNACTQEIHIRNLTPFDLNSVVFPGHVTLINKCMNAGDFGPTNPDTGGYPTWTNTGCSQVAVSYTDQVFNVVEDACFKIIRHWTVIDWCKFDLSTPGSVRNYQQIIKVIDTEKPRAICRDTIVNVTEGCSRLVTLSGNGDDTCTPSDQLLYTYSIDNGAVVNSKILSQNMTVGFHEVRWTVEDKCGNTAACTQIVNVRDAKKPTPYCISELVTVLMPTNLKVAIWAKDYNLGAFDNCNTKLRFTFGPNSPVSLNRAHYYKNVNGVSVETTEAEYLSGDAEYWDPVACSSARIFTCQDLGIQEVTVYVWDEAGNSDYCTVRIKIQDNSGICGQSGNIVADGTVESVRDLPMEGVTITFRDDLAGETFNSQTSAQGAYSHSNFLPEVPYVVSAGKDGDWLNGVSTLDLVLIQRHILGLQPLENKMLLLAADANADGKVTASDLTELRKLILGQTSSLSRNTSWVFVHNQEGNEDLTPWEWPRQAYFTAQPDARYTNNFTGIKVGDVNMNASAGANDPHLSAREDLHSAGITDITIISGKTIRIPVRAGSISSVMGLQMSLAAADEVQIKGIEAGVLDINKSNYHIKADAGKNTINISWNAQSAIFLKPDDVLFELVVTPEVDGLISNLITLTQDGLSPEVTEGDLSARGLRLQFGSESTPAAANVLRLSQNVPNPFSDQTTVSYYLPIDDTVEMTLSDIDGKVLNRSRVTVKSGTHEWTINKSMTGRKSGVILLTLKTSESTATIRMVMIE